MTRRPGPRLKLLVGGAILSASRCYGDGIAEATGECQSTGVGFTNGGSYLIDVASHGNFSFASQFTGNCGDYTIRPILSGPESTQYGCSAIKTFPVEVQQISTCDIPYAVMSSGAWQIIIQSPYLDWTLLREFNLTAGTPTTVITTATPTVFVGITSTPPPITVLSTLTETASSTGRQSTVTSFCSTSTRTVTSQLPPTTKVIESTVVQYSSTDVTRQTNLTNTLTASCTYKTSTITQPDKTTSLPPLSVSCKLVGTPPFLNRGKGKGGPPPWITAGGPPPWISSILTDLPAGPPAWVTWVSCETHQRPQRRHTKLVRAIESVAAWTATYTETTFTATTTSTSLLAPPTVTRYSLKTTTMMITPPPSTFCTNGPDVTQTFTASGLKLTRYSIVSSISYVTRTVFVTQTYFTISNDMAAATACWEAGGSFGIA